LSQARKFLEATSNILFENTRNALYTKVSRLYNNQLHTPMQEQQRTPLTKSTIELKKNMDNDKELNKELDAAATLVLKGLHKEENAINQPDKTLGIPADFQGIV
jgi:hypothetical protein